jgi:hypothetical protein
VSRLLVHDLDVDDVVLLRFAAEKSAQINPKVGEATDHEHHCRGFVEISHDGKIVRDQFEETCCRIDQVNHSLNMGPSHPATHGVLRLILELDGEIITKADPDVGFLHRGDEKIAENMHYNQFVPYTDRLDYLAPLANNVAYALAVEKLMGWELPERGKPFA